MSRDKQIKSTDWLTRGMTEAELAKAKEKAIKEAEAELRDKQIEEMARVLGEGRSQNCSHYVCCSACPCDFCCIFQENAHILVQEGYRKSSDVAREIFEEIEKYVEVALMNGHIETPILCIGHGTFAELKKKYEVDNK